ncbi:hypothetical protein PsexTeo8_32000 [Pseudomonas extremaustralis]|uniref:ADP-ribosylglycohydrolase family protein n=1 Tax=Pseudomonas extremaustralis TaxID=359110 RepID=UPI002AA0BB75|nr:ADP-ribosylglycohydrolase family protein [Pseudomonas extremaustralis]MDY7066736.1 hypothetical protein [Pseudomonas extremaustralis]
MTLTLSDRYRGSLLGLACGDAVGTSVEFMLRGTFEPVTDMLGGGPFQLKAGQWTDDTSMALCLAESLLCKRGFDPADQMTRYLNWWTSGYLSATGECFDIGLTVREALAAFQDHGDPFAQGDYREKTRAQITGSGYCVASLEAALWCVLTTDSFAAAVLAAANLGDDADTTAAIVGQLAGAHYGVQGIPVAWLEKLCMREDIQDMADALFKVATEKAGSDQNLSRR